MKKFFVTLLAALAVTAQAQTLVTGAGATFPAPVYSRWASDYNKATGIKVNYGSIGSSGGIRQMEAKTVDFGATDDPVSVKDLTEKGWYQFPAVIGAVVPVFKIKGIDNLVLDGQTLADIYEGKIKKWNEPAISKLNPGVKLPDLAITVVIRADGSGTTAVFSNYLTQISKSFKDNIGEGKAVKWKGATYTAGKGNAGVAAFVQQLEGTIGYVEFAFVKQSGLKFISLKDKAGKVQQPSLASFQEAASAADWKVPGMAVNLNNQKGWPITSATFIIVPKEGGARTQDVLKFFDWTFSNGDKTASELEYVPLPDAVKTQIRAGWAKNVK